MVEVQPVEGRELVDRHLGLGHERPGLEHDDRAAGRAASAAMTPPPAPEPTITMSASRTIASPGGVRAATAREVERPDRRRVRGHGLRARRRIRSPAGAGCRRSRRVRVGEEREQPLEALVRRPPLRDARGRPAEQVRLAGRLVEVREAGRAAGEQQVRGARLERPEHELELGDLGRVRGEVEGGRREARAPLPVPAAIVSATSASVRSAAGDQPTGSGVGGRTGRAGRAGSAAAVTRRAARVLASCRS